MTKEQSWFEMNDVRRRKFKKAVWIPLRANCTIEKSGQIMTPGFREELFCAISLAVPVEHKDEAMDLTWGNIVGWRHGSYVNEGKYIPSDVYENFSGNPIGIALVLEQYVNSETIWHLHQDIVIALELLREEDTWICPSEGYVEVVKLHRDSHGDPFLMEIRAEFLRDYLCSRNMGLCLLYYRMRKEIVEDMSHIKWPDNPFTIHENGNRWEGRITSIREGSIFGQEITVHEISRADVDPEEDVPVFGLPDDEDVSITSWEIQSNGKECFIISGENWGKEWIEPGEYSPRIRGDKVPGQVFFIVDETGKRESRDTLECSLSRWLWFKGEIIATLVRRRGGILVWESRERGLVGCSPEHGVHFGVNRLGYVNVFAKDIALLPDWLQRIWGGFNISPEGGVSEELLAAQMQCRPASTIAPENRFREAMSSLNRAFQDRFGKPLFREHRQQNEIAKVIHRFRATEEHGLLALAKDITRITTDRIDIKALKSIVRPSKDKSIGSLKLLENVLAKFVDPSEAYTLLTPLVGAYQLRNADAHLPPQEMDNMMEKAGISEPSIPVFKGAQLIENCAISMERIASIFHAKSDTYTQP